MPEYSEYVAEIRKHLAAIAKSETPLDENVDLVAELGLASMEVMELIEQLEDAFDISFPLNDLANVRTIADLAKHIRRLTEASGCA